MLQMHITISTGLRVFDILRWYMPEKSNESTALCFLNSPLWLSFHRIIKLQTIISLKTIKDFPLIKELSMSYSKLECSHICNPCCIEGLPHEGYCIIDISVLLYTHLLANPLQLNHKNVCRASNCHTKLSVKVQFFTSFQNNLDIFQDCDRK